MKCLLLTRFIPGDSGPEGMVLNTNALEEVKKRRGKPSSINIYQRLVLLAGAAGLGFAIWTNPASMPAVGIIGGTLLVFYLLKDSREKQDIGRKIDPNESQSEAKENVDPQAAENVILGEMVPEGKENVDLQAILSAPEEKERAERVD